MQDAKPGREHVLALGMSPIACAACSDTENAVAEGRMVETRHTAASLRGKVRLMVNLCCEYDMKKVEYSGARPMCQKCWKYRETRRIDA